jgi:NADH:ubiquinone oxidoreductase subunit E
MNTFLEVDLDELEPQGYKPSNRHVTWLEYKTTCLQKCGSAAYIMVDGEAMCLMHAFRAVNNLLDRYAPCPQ